MYRTEVWQKWEDQEGRRLAKVSSDQAYIELNNLFLNVERGQTKLTIGIGNILRNLVVKAYGYDDPMVDYWAREFEGLEGWNDV